MCDASQIAAALEHIHSQGVVHCDLKPANVPMYLNNVVKVTDFGICIPYMGAGSLHTANFDVCATTHKDINLLTLDPSGFSFEIDVWSLGMIMAEMELGRNPLYDIDGRNEDKVLQETEAILLTTLGSAFCPQTLQGVKDEETRITARGLLEVLRKEG